MKFLREHTIPNAIFGGFLCSLFASLMMTKLHALFPEFTSQGLEGLSEILSSSPAVVALFFVLVVIISPILEELLFRKFFWWISTRIFPETITMIIISLLFALAHGEMFHVIGLLPISFYLGYLRLKTGSIRLPLAAHIANNVFASVAMML